MSQQVSDRKQFKTYPAGKVCEVLQTLNYPIQDFGDYVRTRAIYRGGDAPNTLKVWKDSGWCRDYAEDKGFSLYDLVSKTLGTTNPKAVLEIINCERVVSISAPRPKFLMAKTYDPKILDRLLPNYSFYEKKKISAATQKLYKMGYATTGQMYQRLTFPIFDENGQIIGFDGRHIYWNEESTFAKWKKLGRKDGWVYPYYSLRNYADVQSSFDSAEEIYIVESIGDSLALTENGIHNHLVAFGKEISAALLAFLIQRDPKFVTIVGNKDSNNQGQLGAIKGLIKLSSVFPVDMLRIKLPTLNDLSEMHESGENLVDWQKNGAILSREEILQTIELNRPTFQTDKLAKFLKKL